MHSFVKALQSLPILLKIQSLSYVLQDCTQSALLNLLPLSESTSHTPSPGLSTSVPSASVTDLSAKGLHTYPPCEMTFPLSPPFFQLFFL